MIKKLIVEIIYRYRAWRLNRDLRELEQRGEIVRRIDADGVERWYPKSTNFEN